jgi:hypothetical protein
MLSSMRFRLSAVAATVATCLCIAAPAADAQPQQGLVNVDLSGNTVQIPIAIAANVCDVNVAVLVEDLQDDTATCTATPEATITPGTGGGGGGNAGAQNGLVNVRISDNLVQVPIAVAVNVCDANVAVLVELLNDASSSCTATPSAGANG